MSIEIKTTGMLLDELITNTLKLYHPKGGDHDRQAALIHILRQRGIDVELVDHIIRLAVVDSCCWFAQETVMSEDIADKVARAAKDAQYFNAQRNTYMRAIDEVTGYTEDTVTEKTYA